MAKRRPPKGKCTVCYGTFTLNSKGDIPWHAAGLTGEACEGTSRAPVPKPCDPNKPLEDSKADFEISLKWNRGHLERVAGSHSRHQGN